MFPSTHAYLLQLRRAPTSCFKHGQGDAAFHLFVLFTGYLQPTHLLSSTLEDAMEEALALIREGETLAIALGRT
jgi:hypothetical protein